MIRLPRRFPRFKWLLATVLLSVLVVLALLNAKARSDFREAQEAYEAVDYRRADQKIHEALRFWFWRPSVHIWAARIARSRYDYATAERQLIAARKYGADDESVQLEWLLMRATGGELDNLSVGLWKTVEGGHEQAGYILESMARQYMRELRFQEAIRCLTFWLKLEPTAVRALDWRGWSYEHLEGFEEAVNDYQSALQLAPGKKDLRLRLAFLYVGLSRPQAALEHLEVLDRNGTMDGNGRIALATCRFQLGQGDSAKQILESVLVEDPRNIMALRQLAKIEQLSNHYSEAESLCRRAVALAPFDTDAHYTLYLSLAAQANREEETAAQERQFKKLMEHRKRVDDLIRQMERYKDKPDVMSELGNLLLNLGQENEGLHWLYEALKKDPRHKPTHEILAKYFETRDPAKAAEHLKMIPKE
jgi:tetratricopeptide (TPR) repeat protein